MDFSYQVYSKCDRCREGKIAKPEILCYYHQKIEDGLIDEPELEYGYVEVAPVDENEDMLTVLQEQLDIVARMICPDHWVEDAKQYASIGYRNVLARWEPDRNAWRTHCAMHIKGRLIDYMRKEGLYAERLIVDPNMESIYGDALDVEQLVLEKEGVDAMHEALMQVTRSELSNMESSILWRRLCNDSPLKLDQLAVMWGVTEGAIRKAEKRIIEKIKEVIDYEI